MMSTLEWRATRKVHALTIGASCLTNFLPSNLAPSNCLYGRLAKDDERCYEPGEAALNQHQCFGEAHVIKYPPLRMPVELSRPGVP